MEPDRPPEGQPQRIRVRRRTKVHRGPPRFLVISIVLCGLLVILIPVGQSLGWWRIGRSGKSGTAAAIQQEQAIPLVPDSALKNPTELVLSEASLQGEAADRRVSGKVRNTTSSRYVNVEVLFTLRSRSGMVVGTAAAKIDEILPNSAASFQTDKVPTDTARQFLRDISGTRR